MMRIMPAKPVIAFVILSIFQGIGHCATIKSMYFTMNPTCFEKTTFEQTTTTPCRRNFGVQRSRTECALKCLENSGCTGVSFNSKGECNIHENCQETDKMCAVEDKTTSFFFEKSSEPLTCYNGGTWISAEARCQCVGGWVGARCERLAEVCVELMFYNYARGDYPNILNMPNTLDFPIRLTCSLLYKTTTSYTYTTVYSNNPSMNQFDFNKTWSEYENGIDTKRYWIGLNNLHHLTARVKTELIFSLTLKDNQGKEVYLTMLYAGVQISNADDHFKIDFESSQLRIRGDRTFYDAENISIIDCLTPLVGAKFSTFDKDNDENDMANCALMAGNGWWFKNCNEECNYFGNLYEGSSAERPFSYDRIRIGGLDMHRYAANILKISSSIRAFKSDFV